MGMGSSDSWNSVRQAFLDQFEPDKDAFIYRRSQKGEAIRVTASERDRFIDDFELSLRRSKWIIFAGIAILIGGELAVSFLDERAPSPVVIYVGVALTFIPYLAHHRFAWAAPSRELAGRTPIARERSRDEVRRLQFKRISYGQLGLAALFGLALPFIVTPTPLSGWSRSWLAAGAGIALVAGVQAFRKWRLEQDEPTSTQSQATQTPEEKSGWSRKTEVLRLAALVVLLLGAASLALTDAGKDVARHPYFLSGLMLAICGWSVSTVIFGLVNGKIEPLVRGFNVAYDRESQPLRFWASLTWNAIIGSFLLWLAVVGYHDAKQRGVRERCQNKSQSISAGEALSACDRLVQMEPSDAQAFVDRGVILLDAMKLDRAIADFTTAHELDPQSPWPLANRGMSYAWKYDQARAARDFEAVRMIDPANPVMLRGQALLGMQSRDWQGAIDILSTQLSEDPKDLWSLNMRAFAYERLGKVDKSQADRTRLQELTKPVPVKRESKI
jgi:Flp pilus assembly protein TadD